MMDFTTQTIRKDFKTLKKTQMKCNQIKLCMLFVLNKYK